jgi:hypothetical protein
MRVMRRMMINRGSPLGFFPSVTREGEVFSLEERTLEGQMNDPLSY